MYLYAECTHTCPQLIFPHFSVTFSHGDIYRRVNTKSTSLKRNGSSLIFCCPFFLSWYFAFEAIEYNLQPWRQLYCRVHCWVPWWEPQRGCSSWSSWSCSLSDSAIDPDLRRTRTPMTTAAWRTWRQREPAPPPRVTNRRPCPSAPIASRALRRILI